MLNSNFIKAVDNLELKYPVSQIAKDLSVSKGTVSSYYNGNIKASDSFLERFANFYKLELENLKNQQEEKSLTQTENTGVPYYDVDVTADFYSLKHLFLDELDKSTNSALNLSKEMA